MTGTGYLITLNDQYGRMIYLKGESHIMKLAEKMNFAPVWTGVNKLPEQTRLEQVL